MTTEHRLVLRDAVSIDPEMMHGTPCFTGTRIPAQTLMDFLETGETIDDFLAVYPRVTREQVITFLDFSKELAFEQLECVSS